MRLELHVPDPAAREGKGRSNDFPALLQDPCTGDSCSSCDGRRCALQFVMIGPDTYGARRCRGDYAQRGGGRMSHTHARGVSLRMARLDYSIYVLYIDWTGVCTHTSSGRGYPVMGPIVGTGGEVLRPTAAFPDPAPWRCPGQTPPSTRALSPPLLTSWRPGWLSWRPGPEPVERPPSRPGPGIPVLLALGQVLPGLPSDHIPSAGRAVRREAPREPPGWPPAGGPLARSSPRSRRSTPARWPGA